MTAADHRPQIEGRIQAIRRMKRTTFVDLEVRGALEQLLFTSDDAGSLREGDLIRVAGDRRRTQTGAEAIEVDWFDVRARWQAGDHRQAAQQRVTAHVTRSGAARIRSTSHVVGAAWETMMSAGYRPVATETVLERYNGGASKPIAAMMGTERLGYLRITMEERLLQALASGLGSVFQVGPIVKGGREHLFLEGYAADSSVEDLLVVIRRLIDSVQGSPLEIERRSLLPMNVRTAEEAAAALSEMGVGVHAAGGGDEQAALVERLERTLVRDASGWLIVDRLPVATAPLYRSIQGQPGVSTRARIYAHGEFVFDLGVQETEVDVVANRLANQRLQFEQRFDANDPRLGERELLDVLRAGVPPCAGFSGRLDVLARLWSS